LARSFFVPHRLFAPLAFAVGLAGILGCGKYTPAGEVSGQVTFKGKPVAEGLVSFMNAEAGTGGEGRITNGTYSLAAPLQPGEYKVTVMPLVVRQQDGGRGPEVGVEKPAPDIPNKYRTIGTTDLKASVKPGKNEVNFDLKP
jgi:hypothetical protein